VKKGSFFCHITGVSRFYSATIFQHKYNVIFKETSKNENFKHIVPCSWGNTHDVRVGPRSCLHVERVDVVEATGSVFAAEDYEFIVHRVHRVIISTTTDSIRGGSRIKFPHKDEGRLRGVINSRLVVLFNKKKSFIISLRVRSRAVIQSVRNKKRKNLKKKGAVGVGEKWSREQHFSVYPSSNITHKSEKRSERELLSSFHLEYSFRIKSVSSRNFPPGR